MDYILTQVLALAPGFSRALAEQVEAQVRARFGGERVFVPKKSRRLTPQEREAVYRDGLSELPTDEILQKHRISRATLYRAMKGGGGRFA